MPARRSERGFDQEPAEPEAERPPIYEIPEWNQPGWRATPIDILDVAAYYERSMENGLDPAHNEFVHPSQGSPGLEPDYLKKGLNLQDSAWGTRFFVSFDEKTHQESAFSGLRASKKGVRAGSGNHGPNHLQTWINFSATNAFHQYFFEAPVDASHTRIFFINTRNCMMDPAMDARAREANLKVANEDIAVLTKLNPVRTPESNTKEILLTGDMFGAERAQQMGLVNRVLPEDGFEAGFEAVVAAIVEGAPLVARWHAAEFDAATPYFYSTYEQENEAIAAPVKKAVVIGSGPIRIGQGIEFDYCSVHASMALRESGYQSIMVNSNHETVSTDFDTSDRLYFEALDEESLRDILENENVEVINGKTASGA